MYNVRDAGLSRKRGGNAGSGPPLPDPGLSFSSHPQGLPSAKFKLLIFGRKLIQWKMKIAVHMYFEERQHYCPAMLEFKSIPSEIQQFAQTVA